MKTAERHAADIMAEGDGGAIVRHLREYARDQRHLCAERVASLPTGVYNGRGREHARDAVMNAPEPGQ
jgi:hypothetical protein